MIATRSTCAMPEAPIQAGIRQATVDNDGRATELMFRSYLNTARVARNSVASEAVGREGLETGDPEHGIRTAGMVQRLIHDIPTVGGLLDRFVAEAEEIICGRSSSLIGAQAAADAGEERRVTGESQHG